MRLAHYPHARLAYELTDEAGLLVWAENGHSNANKTTETGDRITREMIRQNYNHPSIVMWSVGNENAYVRVNRFAEIAQAEDPNRLVTYASNTGARGKKRYPTSTSSPTTPTAAGIAARRGSSSRWRSRCATSPRTAAAR